MKLHQFHYIARDLSSIPAFTIGLVLLCCVDAAQAQVPKLLDINVHGWFSYSGDHDIKGRWGLHFDGQWRRSDFVTEWQQYQARPGLNYRLNQNLLLTLGYVYTRAYPYGDSPPVRTAFPEHRIYQQAIMRHSKRSVILQQRYRLEQRFVKYPNASEEYTYQNRFRYLLKADFPLTRTASGAVEWYLPIYDEVAIGLPPNYGARLWDQNRLFVGVGYSLGVPGNIEVGYLNQFLGQRNGRVFEFNNTFFVTFTSNYSFADLFAR